MKSGNLSNYKIMNMKVIWNICWVISILYVFAILAIPFLYILYAKDHEAQNQLNEIIRQYSVSMPFKFAGLVTFIFWINNLVKWKKRQDGILNLLLLLFLNVLYAPVYHIIKK